MAFELDNLDRLMENPAKGPSLYTYKTTDALGTAAGQVRSNGYFNGLIPYLPLGTATPNEDMPVILCILVNAQGSGLQCDVSVPDPSSGNDLNPLRRADWT